MAFLVFENALFTNYHIIFLLQSKFSVAQKRHFFFTKGLKTSWKKKRQKGENSNIFSFFLKKKILQPVVPGSS